MKTLHGLPEQVIFCKKCVVSNQRPNTAPEHLKQNSDIATIGFDTDGVCHTCKYHEYKKTIDWADRERQLIELLDKYRRDDGRYDVIVPGSGGKDSSYVSHVLKYKYGMHPLTVTWAPHMYTDIGWKNMQSWIRSGLDNILVTPNPKVHALLTRLAFENLVNPFQPFIIGQKNVAPRAALQYDVPLIMYGENQAEAHNTMGETISPIMDRVHYTRPDPDSPLFFGGVPAQQILEEHGLEQVELFPYLPLLEEDVVRKGVEIHYMSHYVNWSPQDNYYYSQKHTGFESNPDGRSEGTYSKFSSLDDRIDGQHYFTMFIKFGQGRAMNDACRDIRDGFITREEGVELVRKYDGEFPGRYFQECLQYMGITEERYWEVIDSARSPHLWEKTSDGWRLKHQVS